MAGKNKVIKSEAEFTDWFKQNYKKLGYQKILKKEGGKFPDFLVLKGNKKIGIELETFSSNFLLHKHNIKYVDEIVCIKKDVDLDIPIIEAKGLDYIIRIARISATIDEKTVKLIELILKTGKYRNKSHVIEKAIELLAEEER